MAKPDQYQSYMEFEPMLIPDGRVECDHFWDIKNKGSEDAW